MNSSAKRAPLFIGICVLNLFLGCEYSSGQKSADAGLEAWAEYQTICDSADPVLREADTDERTVHPKSVLRGIAIMGDSDSDEYRADDNRGGKYASTTFNWVEQLALNRGLNFGCWGTWPEPRRTGFAFNWARSGATAASLLSGGQHTGVASQVAVGKVTLVFLHVGSNDFLRGRYEEIYYGNLSDRDVRRKVADFVANITTAVDTVLDAGPVAVVIVDIQNPGASPLVVRKYPQATGRQRVALAIDAVNAGLKAMADKRGAVLVSSADITEAALARIDKDGKLQIGGRAIDILNAGNAPTHLQLADKGGHAGTIASGLLANAWFIEPVNTAIGTSIVPFGDVEILRTAGVAQ